jgi:hypothetical protein
MYRACDFSILLVLFRIHLTKDRMLKISGSEDVIDRSILHPVIDSRPIHALMWTREIAEGHRLFVTPAHSDWGKVGAAHNALTKRIEAVLHMNFLIFQLCGGKLREVCLRPEISMKVLLWLRSDRGLSEKSRGKDQQYSVARASLG